MRGTRHGSATESTRYLQLFDCGHILEVEEMDAWMMRESGSEIQLLRCPRCSVAITFSFRYGNLIKRTLMNNEKVKKEIDDLTSEVRKACVDLMGDLNHQRDNVELMKFPRDIRRSLVQWRFQSVRMNEIHPRNIPLMFIIKNHLLIMRQVAIAQLSLQRIAGNQGSSKEKELVEIHEHSSTIGQALENILEYLRKPQLDLKILYQVHEHTKMFFLFASILEAHCEAIKYQRSLSSIGETRLKLARNGLHSFLQGNSNAMQMHSLQRIVVFLWNEVGLGPFSPEDAKDLENFPGFNAGVWKLCAHGHVYFNRLILRGGEDVPTIRNSCRDCAGGEEDDEEVMMVES